MTPYAGAITRQKRVPLSAPPGWMFIGPFIVPLVRRILILEIQARVADHYHLPLIEMRSARRSREVARPRQVAMYLARNLTLKSLPEIGRMFGGRDHTTVIHAIRAIGARRVEDAELECDIRRLTARLEGLA